jgi:hypothetical protein
MECLGKVFVKVVEILADFLRSKTMIQLKVDLLVVSGNSFKTKRQIEYKREGDHSEALWIGTGPCLWGIHQEVSETRVP